MPSRGRSLQLCGVLAVFGGSLQHGREPGDGGLRRAGGVLSAQRVRRPPLAMPLAQCSRYILVSLANLYIGLNMARTGIHFTRSQIRLALVCRECSFRVGGAESVTGLNHIGSVGRDQHTAGFGGLRRRRSRVDVCPRPGHVASTLG